MPSKKPNMRASYAVVQILSDNRQLLLPELEHFYYTVKAQIAKARRPPIKRTKKRKARKAAGK